MTTETAGTTEVQEYDSGLSVEKHNTLANTFNPFMVSVQELVAAADQVEVASADDTKAMARAREVRLSLKKIRVDVEHARKELKDSSLREGKAIDGMANIIKFVIVPVEEKLQEQEDFVRVQEAKRIADLVEAREGRLAEAGADPSVYVLDALTDEAFETLLQGVISAKEIEKKAAEDEAKRLEDERLERKRLEKENADLKRAEEERVAKEKAKAEAEEKERQAQIQSEKDAEQARLNAPDKEKLQALATTIYALPMPEVDGEIAEAAIQDVKDPDLAEVMKNLEKQMEEPDDNAD